MCNRKECTLCLYPEDGPCLYHNNTLMILAISTFLVFLYMCVMVILFGVYIDNHDNSESDLSSWNSQLKKEIIALAKIEDDIRKCYNGCGLITCDDCCPACEWSSAPAAPTSTDLWRFPTSNNSLCTNNAYASLDILPPSSICRLGNLQFSYCGFRNDYSISLLEYPHSPVPVGYGNGTIIASRLQNTIPNNVYCVSLLASFSPAGTSTFVLQGDQTGFTVSFDITVLESTGGTLCDPIVCSYLVP
jgi:hypothetical protein